MDSARHHVEPFFGLRSSRNSTASCTSCLSFLRAKIRALVLSDPDRELADFVPIVVVWRDGGDFSPKAGPKFVPASELQYSMARFVRPGSGHRSFWPVNSSVVWPDLRVRGASGERPGSVRGNVWERPGTVRGLSWGPLGVSETRKEHF